MTSGPPGVPRATKGATTNGRLSVIENGEIQVAEAVEGGEHVDVDDFAVAHREVPCDPGPSVHGPDDTDSSVDQRGLGRKRTSRERAGYGRVLTRRS